MTTPASDTQRRRVIFHGHVQGVGFRATTANIARALPVTGLVRNLPDGTVELQIQGSPKAIDAVLSEIAQTFDGFITRREESPMDRTTGERGLIIAH